MSSCVGILIVCGSKNSIHAKCLGHNFRDVPQFLFKVLCIIFFRL